jgi:uncharacterized protein YPO0396
MGEKRMIEVQFYKNALGTTLGNVIRHISDVLDELDSRVKNLERENAELKSELETVKQERDTARYNKCL